MDNLEKCKEAFKKLERDGMMFIVFEDPFIFEFVYKSRDDLDEILSRHSNHLILGFVGLNSEEMFFFRFCCQAVGGGRVASA